MSDPLTTDLVWQEIEKQLFGVLGMVTAKNEARTVGIVYVVDNRKLYIGSKRTAWKVRHIAQNSNVSCTIPIHKRIPFMPWIKIPAATITFSGKAVIKKVDEIPPQVLTTLFEGMTVDEGLMQRTAVIQITAVNDFITYGVGVSLLDMRTPAKAQRRVPVG